VRRLEFLGTGEDEADEVCSDFLDIIAHRGLEDLVCQEVWQFLTRQAAQEWDVAGFRNTLPDSLIERYLPSMARGSDRVMDSRPEGERFYIDLSGGSFERWVEGLSRQRQKRIFYYRRRLEREGGLEERRLERREEIPHFLAETARLNRLRRSLLGKPSAFASERFRRFQATCAPLLFDRQWLDARLYYRQGRCVAALYNFIYADTICYYQCGFDTAAFGNVSPGLVTLSQVIEWGFRNGKRRFDFLVGGGAYKEDYDCVAEPVHEVQLYNKTLAGQLVRSARGVRDLLRQARDRAQAASAPPTASVPLAAH
jgi:CelD/BcsL family acetyltransferase involved in cellulose biosynthesis